MKFDVLTAGQIFDEWKEEQGPETKLNRNHGISYINEAISSMITANLWVNQIVLINIDNYRGKLPSQFKRQIQVLFKTDYTHKCNRVEIAEWTNEYYKQTNCQLKIKVECPHCTPNPCECDSATFNITPYEAEYLFPQTRVAHQKHVIQAKSYNELNINSTNVKHLRNQFFEIFVAQNNFFGLSQQLGECELPNYAGTVIETQIEYKIEPPIIRLNIKSGQVLMSCLSAPADEMGDLYVPNHEMAIRAVKSYLDSKVALANYKRKPSNSTRTMWMDFKNEWLKYLPIAKSKINVMDPAELVMLMNNHMSKMITYHDSQTNLNRRKPDQFNYNSF